MRVGLCTMQKLVFTMVGMESLVFLFVISSFDTVNGTVENCFGLFTGIEELYIERYISQIVSVVYRNWYKNDFRFHKQ